MRGAAASPSSRPASTFPAGKPQEPVQKLLVRIGGQRGDFLGQEEELGRESWLSLCRHRPLPTASPRAELQGVKGD